MKVFYEEQKSEFNESCATTGCLIGNAIMRDPFFEQNGLYLVPDKEDRDGLYRPVFFGEDYPEHAVASFFDISINDALDLFFNSLNEKDDALEYLKLYIDSIED